MKLTISTVEERQEIAVQMFILETLGIWQLSWNDSPLIDDGTSHFASASPVLEWTHELRRNQQRKNLRSSKSSYALSEIPITVAVLIFALKYCKSF